MNQTIKNITRGKSYKKDTSLVTLCALVSMFSAVTHSAPVVVPTLSTFDGGLDGWTTTVSAEWLSAGGNTGGFISGTLQEPTNTTSFAFASSSYQGDWTAFDGVGAFSYDYRRTTTGGGNIIAYLPFFVEITGPGGSATWTGDTITGTFDWLNVEALISESEWNVGSGSWAGILANVTEVAIQIELVSNDSVPDDQAGIDNVMLTTTVVPLPATVWLFGSGLIGLIGLASRKKFYFYKK